MGRTRVVHRSLGLWTTAPKSFRVSDLKYTNDVRIKVYLMLFSIVERDTIKAGVVESTLPKVCDIVKHRNNTRIKVYLKFSCSL